MGPSWSDRKPADIVSFSHDDIHHESPTKDYTDRGYFLLDFPAYKIEPNKPFFFVKLLSFGQFVIAIKRDKYTAIHKKKIFQIGESGFEIHASMVYVTWDRPVHHCGRLY